MLPAPRVVPRSRGSAPEHWAPAWDTAGDSGQTQTCLVGLHS